MSCSGMLAAYMRIRYPWQVAGAVAGSAPILYFSGEGAVAGNVSNDVADHRPLSRPSPTDAQN